MTPTTEPNLPLLVSRIASITTKALQCINRVRAGYFAHVLNVYG